MQAVGVGEMGASFTTGVPVMDDRNARPVRTAPHDLGEKLVPVSEGILGCRYLNLVTKEGPAVG